MKSRHYIVYVSGLGDDSDKFRSRALKLWRILRIKTQLVPMKWDQEMTFKNRFNSVNQAIDSAKEQGYTVSVVGESAGASMAINVVAKRHDIHRLVTVCGTDNPDMKIAPKTLKRSPGFGESMHKLSEALPQLDVKKVHTISAKIDRVLENRHTVITGATNHSIFSFGHIFTVSLCLTLLSGYIIRLIKN